MRLTRAQRTAIKHVVRERLGPDARVLVFGSRLDDTRKGGDLDLLVEFETAVDRPAVTAAQLATRISRILDGRNVDVLLHAPSLKELPIHRVAQATGEPL